MNKKVFGLTLTIILLSHSLWANDLFSTQNPEKRDQWVDSVFQSLNQEQRIGQLFMIAAYSNKNESHYAEIERLIRNHHIGGLIFMQGGPVRQAQLTNRYQAASRVPLLLSIDGEWGLSMRLDSTTIFPKQITLGAIQDNSYIYSMGKEIARQAKRVGLHVNFAPVVDINTNPRNPVIGYRAFGEDKNLVAEKGIAYMRGMQDHGIIANAKHFPGHGDTDTDSHLTLPVIRHSKERFEQEELYPFRRLMDEGLMSMMVAHIHIPAYDNTPNRATTLSPAVVDGLLKRQMGFEGLVFTDALNMQGVAKFYEPGDVDVRALLAGNDVLLFSGNVPLGVQKIKAAIASGQISQEEVDRRVKKILRAKYWVGLNEYEAVNTTNLVEDLNHPKAESIRRQLYEKAATVVRNDQRLLPIRVVDTASFASLSVNSTGKTSFQKTLEKYANFQHFNTDGQHISDAKASELLYKLSTFDYVVVSFHKMNHSLSKSYGLSASVLNMLNELNKKTHVIVNVGGNPYSLKFLTAFDHLLVTYEDADVAQEVAAQVIFGALSASGRLPVTASETYPAGAGVNTFSLKRLNFAVPEGVGMSSQVLAKIDKIMHQAMEDSATPGGQILIAKKGSVVYNESFGYHTYEKNVAVDANTIYDLASITKVAASMQAIMFLQERNLIDLDKTVGDYLEETKGSNKEHLLLKDILLHEAGLTPFIPFWKRTLSDGGYDPLLINIYPEYNFPRQVSLGLFSHEAVDDSIWQWTIDSDLIKKNRKGKYPYKYSDVGYYIMKKIVERVVSQPMEEFLEHLFYEPMGLYTLGYQPLCKFPIDRIAPTALDVNFRNELICGTVHDEGAALLGGVAGHAGLFSNAFHLAALMQMNLQGGTYGGARFLFPNTIQYFTAKQTKENRRGFGWDKPLTDGDNGPTSRYASAAAYGHTGFTGTAVWVDPVFDLIFVFLSNRVHPSADNRKLISHNIRTRIQDVIYESIFEFEREYVIN
ncbi:MAG: serine hydrolase [Cyclobacteriaceae bacterium]|nr:serine hydrolase [Cyclobacteriaceae bacterium]MCH8515658.1 serine hydrolase [Cyclobacteriaceae bacterium]